MPHSILFLCNPAMKSLALLDALPDEVSLAVTLDAETVAARAPEADVLVLNTDDQELIRLAVTKGERLRWIHSLMAGVEKKLIPEICESELPLTNARGVFAESLGEFAVASCLFYAKDFRRMMRQQASHRWEPFDVEEVAGKTMVILGYGEIGRACARRAAAMGMRVVGVRRRPELSEGDPHVERVVSFEERREGLRQRIIWWWPCPTRPTPRVWWARRRSRE
ncbi:MAG: NAD(P)-dependent oxidoreductase [Bryobacterales bacterium]|nr:NAD(P)-dependent oxidoreductase [Bryobacterales bacterium]